MECIYYNGRGIVMNIPGAVATKLDQSTSIEIGTGATIDINCNTLVSFSDDDFTGADYATINNRKPFKLIFPLESIVKPYRPLSCGIKYAISGDIAISGTYTDPKNNQYSPKNGNTYRTYFPSKNLYYKYYVTPVNTNASLSVRYYNNAAPISYQNKSVPCNKIVLKFELAHSTPSSWAILVNGSDVTAALSKTIPSDGVVTIYYTGTVWSRNESDLNYNSQVSISTLGMTAVNPGGYIGIIELAPHWVKDLTSRIVSFNIRKDSSSNTKDILPVGLVTANSVDMQLNAYESGTTNILFKTYEKNETVAIDTSYIYMIKHAEIKPYYKFYDATGTSSDSKGAYFKIDQGLYYLDSWDIGEFGDTSIFAMDAAKILQETVCPDIFCENYSAIAIIRRILDSVGFTSYAFNFNGGDDKSIIGPTYWWSDGTQTVWNVIQDLCQDSQMSAVFDESGILRFYSRDYMFNRPSASVNWTFRNAPSGNTLANIISLNMNSLPSSNQVKVLYNTAYIAAYEQSSKEITEVDKTWLASASLDAPLTEASDPAVTPGTYYVQLGVTSSIPEQITSNQVLQSFSGYILLNSEIIEYDAIQFAYRSKSNPSIEIPVDITGPSDFAKYRGDAVVDGSTVFFTPTNKYRIKTRGALGSKKTSHVVSSPVSGWTGYKDTWV